jgi:hypothetical protein
MLKVIVSIIVYMVLALLAASGGVQIAALRGGLAGLAWPVGPRYRRFGYVLAGLLIAIAFFGGLLAGFVVGPPSPLLAVVVIFFAMGLAVAVAVVGGAVRLRWNRRHQPSVPRQGRQVDLGPMQAFFYQPAGDGPAPGICLLPDPTAPDDDLDTLVRALVEGGIAVLLLDWQSLGSADRLTLQGLVAVGFSHLARWPEIDAGRVGLLGVGAGGDLALAGPGIHE